MNSLDYDVITRALEWLRSGHQVHLFTVVQTWGSSPRLPGALLALRADGHLVGSVSGGCIEDDLADKAVNQQLPKTPALMEYGVSQDDAQRFGIPCGGRLQILVEPSIEESTLLPLLNALENKQLIRRSINLSSGHVGFTEALPGSSAGLEGEYFHNYFGPKARLLIIGANQLGVLLASMAQTLEFEVLICDPRDHVKAEWRVPGTQWIDGMPDDVIVEIRPDANTAIVAVTHDPKLDDMALLEALKCDAFYVGALGSERNQQNRRDRLLSFDLTADEVARLHGPVGLRIGSRTPAEIAIAILAEIIQVRSQQRQSATIPHQLGEASKASSACKA
ncbi:MAG: XdhC family protein [Methylophilaceae bacterium]|nr:XdhC family protein [Methyloradius sp.]